MPNKNQIAAERAAQAALQRTPQLSLASSDAALPARQEGRTPLRNTYRIAYDLVEPDPQQPRQFFDERELAELAASIASRDIKQPLTVRWNPDTQRYRIIDGERRYRAARLAQQTELPCLVLDSDSRDVLLDQIVHNWQRSDLRPYETADALVRLKREFQMSLEEIAHTVGKSKGEVSKLIALVERVDPAVQERVRSVADASLTRQHLYALTAVPAAQQLRFALRIEREHLTAAETERLIRAGLEPSTTKRTTRGRPVKHIRLVTKFGAVQLTPNRANPDKEWLLGMLHEAKRLLIED